MVGLQQEVFPQLFPRKHQPLRSMMTHLTTTVDHPTNCSSHSKEQPAKLPTKPLSGGCLANRMGLHARPLDIPPGWVVWWVDPRGSKLQPFKRLNKTRKFGYEKSEDGILTFNYLHDSWVWKACQLFYITSLSLKESSDAAKNENCVGNCCYGESHDLQITPTLCWGLR